MTDPSASSHPSTFTGPRQTHRRRGLLAAVAAVAVGGLAPPTARPVQAGTDGDLVLNVTNTGSAATILQAAPGLSNTVLLTVSGLTSTATGYVDGIYAFAHGVDGIGVSGSGQGGRGGNFDGGASPTGGPGGTGVHTLGGNGSGNRFAGGHGLQAIGGFGSGIGPGGHGIRAFGGGGGGNGGPNGVGIMATGGGTAPDQASGVVGLTSSTANPAVSGQNSGAGDGVYGNSTAGIGVRGTSNAQTGVYGSTGSGVGARGDAVSGIGVIGTSVGNNGMFGLSPNAGNGVFGQSGSGNGVLGQATNGGNGVQGLTTSGTGVFGSAGAGTGVFGTSVSGAGVAGSSANNNAVFGDASAAGNGVFARTVSGNGLVAQATGGGNAAQFFGNVIVTGNFTVAPGFAKSGAVAFSDGSVRRLYATEAPESWFEDYGEAHLVNGRASVLIPPDFLQAVNTNVPYHVFPVAHATGVEALAVTVRASDHFEVEANGKGQVQGTFSYRIVAKRKDVPGPRFEPVSLGAAPAHPALDAAVHAGT